MITEKDCKGAIKDYPPHIVELMLDEQEKQGNPRNVAVFQEKADAGYFEGGFTWKNSTQGAMFWSSIHNGKKFEIYPEPETVKSALSKEVIKKTDEVIEASDEIKVGSEVLIDFPNARALEGFQSKKKTVISIIESDKGPIYVCVSDLLLEKLMACKTNQSGVSTHYKVRLYKPEIKKVKLTLKDISEGKGVGIPPELIEIVN